MPVVLAVVVGIGFTDTLTVCVFTQAFVVPVTVYTVDDAGETVIDEVVAPVFHE